MKKEALFYEKLGDRSVHCFLCSRHCRIADNSCGACGVRENTGGALYTLVYGEIINAEIRSFDKIPVSCFRKDENSYCIGTAGCNFSCGFCGLRHISQMKKRRSGNHYGYSLAPEELVENALNNRCTSITYSYPEPTVYIEYVLDIARLARERGLRNIFVTNGYMTREAADAVEPFLDAISIRLYSCDEYFYRQACGVSVEPVLDIIRYLVGLDVWTEVLTEVITGSNDTIRHLDGISKFISGLGREIPWHLKDSRRGLNRGRIDSVNTEFLRSLETAKNNGLSSITCGREMYSA